MAASLTRSVAVRSDCRFASLIEILPAILFGGQIAFWKLSQSSGILEQFW